MIKYLIHFRSLTLICLCSRSGAGGGAGRGRGRERRRGSGRSGFRLFICRRVTFHPSCDRAQGGRQRKGSVANVSVTASICHCVSRLSRTTSSNLVSRGTSQCPGNHFCLLNNSFPAGLLLDQTTNFTRQLINCHINLLSMLTSLLDWIGELRPG